MRFSNLRIAVRPDRSNRSGGRSRWYDGRVRRRLASVAAIAAALALAVLLRPGGAVEAQPAADELLRVESHLTYDVRPDVGPVHITWQVTLQNNDPSTAYSDFGISYYYSSVTVPIFRGAASVGAAGPGGGALSVSVDESGSEVVMPASIAFDQAVFYGDSYSFTLSYDIPSVRNEALLVTPAYVFIPAIAHGDSSTVTINTPEGAGWDVTVEDAETDTCTKSAGSYQCSAPDDIIVPAVVEVSRPDALRNLKSNVEVASGTFDVTVQFFPGEEAWAQHVQEITAAALPVLEELFGVPYDGPRTLTIAERGRQDIAGYDGLFDCPVDQCEIGISPIATDHTAVHELAHLWTGPYDARWIGEGLAEFMSLRAAERIGPLVAADPQVSFDLIDFQLDNWPSPGYIIGASEEELRREGTGYSESLRMFETLERRIGLEAIQQANAAAAAQGSDVDSQAYFDMLEEASAANLDELFLAEVFPPSHAQVLEQRRAVRTQLDALRARTEENGLEVPKAVEDFVSDWRFDRAEEAITEAQAALDAYADARERADASRSLWQRIGLLGKDPDGKLADARTSFNVGEFAGAQRRADEASEIIDGASQAALYRVLIALGALAALAVVLGGSVWLLRRRRSRQAEA